jgi:hypothetical protein
LKEQNKNQLDLIKMQFDAEQKERDRESKEAIEIMKAEVQAFFEGLRIDIGRPGIGTELNG